MDTPVSSVPRHWLDGCIAAHRRLDVLLASLTDDLARRPSLLPDWTVGHLLTHLARNADSQTGMVRAAQRGETGAQYPGGPPQRAGDIAAGQGRTASALVADVRAASQRLEDAWATTSDEVWATGLGRPSSGPRTIAELVFRRWREVELHRVDLGLTELGSPDWEGLSPAYIAVEWAETLARLSDRVPESLTVVLVLGDRPSRAYGTGRDHAVVRGHPALILAWLLGRGAHPSWPVLRPWE